MTDTSTLFATTKRIARRFGMKRAVGFWLTARRDPALMGEWLAFLDQYVPESQRDAMMLRVLRPYMRQHFTPAQRRALLREHTLRVGDYFINDERLTAEPGLVVATLTGKGDAAYTLHIGGNTSKEGEMAFTMCDAGGGMLAKLAGSVGLDESGAPVLWIGALQGAKPPMGRDDIVKATRDLFGLRPKGAVLLVAQYFARALGLTALRAPGNEGHISQRGFRRLRSKRKIHADYGQFWEEIGGILLAPEEYQLPTEPLVRDVAEVKPNKRAEWKKRQAITEALTASVDTALTSVQRAN